VAGALAGALLAAAMLAGPAGAQAPPTQTLTVTAAADTYVVSSSPGTSFGGSDLLRADASPESIAYLRFVVSGLAGRPVVTARLRLTVTGRSASGGTVHLISDPSWSEATVTWASRPPVDGPGLATVGAVDVGDVAEFDLSGSVGADGTYVLALDSASADGVVYASREVVGGQGPTLILAVAPLPEPSVTILQPPDGASFFAGDRVTLEATATDAADGDLEASIAWHSDLQGDLGSGAVVTTPLAEGTHAVTASVTDSDGLTGADRIRLSVGPRPAGDAEPLVAVTAPDDGQRVAGGEPVEFEGTAHDLEDGVLTPGLVWTSDRDGPLGMGGAFWRILSDGAHRITASATDSGGLAGAVSVAVTVVPTTLEFLPLADAYVDAASRTTNFGTAPLLRVDADIARTTHLRFVVSGVDRRQVAQASLRLRVGTAAGAGSVNAGTVHTISDGTWRERAVTYSTRPEIDGPALAGGGRATAGQIVAFDVTAAVGGDGTYDLAIRSGSSDGVEYQSRETTSPPTLVLTLRPGPPTVTIGAPPDGGVVFTDQLPLSLAGTATGAGGADLSAGLTWTSSRDGALGAGALVSVPALGLGVHTITAAVGDLTGLTGTAAVAIRVREPNRAPGVAITAPAPGASVPAGTGVTLAAVASDDFDGDVSERVMWTSDRDGPLGTGARVTVIPSEGRHTLSARATDGDGATGTSLVTLEVAPSPPMVAITEPADGTTVFAGRSLTFRGIAADATDGDLGAALVWTSDRDGPLGTGASVTPGALGIGLHTVTALATDRGGLTAAAQVTVLVRPPNVPPALRLVAPAGDAPVLAGRPVLLFARATDAEDGDLGAAITWSSSRDGALGNGASRSVVLSQGTHTLTAAVTDRDGATASASVPLAVRAPTLTFGAVADTYVDEEAPTTALGRGPELSVDATPVRQAFLRFAVGGVAPFAVERALLRLRVGSGTGAAGADGGGTVHRISNATWTEGTTTYARRPVVDGPALAARPAAVRSDETAEFDVTAAVGGDGSYDFALVHGSSDGVTYRSREAATGRPALVLTLGSNARPAVIITGPPTGASVAWRTGVTFTAQALDAESGDLAREIEWRSSRDGLLGRGGTLTVATLGAGAHTIAARVTDPGGASGEDTIDLYVNHPPEVAITAPATGVVLLRDGLTLVLRGTATDVEDGDVGAALVWASDLAGPLGTGPAVTVSALEIGTHRITATATDAAGDGGMAAITVRVRDPNVAPAVTITAPAPGASFRSGRPVTFAATARDDFEGDLGPLVVWSSSRDGMLGVGASLAVTPSEGSHTLTARVTDSDGATSMATVTVVITATPPVVTITAPVTGTRIFVDRGLRLQGTAIDFVDGDLSRTLVWASDREGFLGRGASVTTTALRVGTHTVTAVATDSAGLIGQSERTVVVRPPNVAPQVTIQVPAAPSWVVEGNPLVLAATALDLEDGNLSQDLRWTSSLDGPLGASATLVVGHLSVGAHDITAGVTDRDGATASASVPVKVGPRTIALAAAADTYVDEDDRATAFGEVPTLVVDGSPARRAFLRFVPSGIAPLEVVQATLRLTVGSSASAASTSGGTLRAITNHTWSEATTWRTRPPIDGPVLGALGAVAPGQGVTFDVTAAVPGDGTHDFALVGTSGDGAQYQSREALTGAPELTLTLRGPAEPLVTVEAPAPGVLAFGEVVSFRGTAADRQGVDLSSSLQWISSRDGALGTGPAIARALSLGTHTISAIATDAGRSAGSATVVIEVRQHDGEHGFRDFRFPASVQTEESRATAQKPESKAWYHDGRWWATLYSRLLDEHTIHYLERVTETWVDTGVLIDERELSRQDVLWDGQKLYMVSRHDTGSRLLRFGYDAAAGTHTLDPGFPVGVASGEIESLTIAKDSTGRLWIAYVQGGTVWVSHSLGSDLEWTTPFRLPVSKGMPVAVDDLAAVVALPGKIGVFWSNQLDFGFYFAVHADGAAPDDWDVETAASGGHLADDHFNMKVAGDGRLFVAIKTSRNDPDDLLVGLLVRSPTGGWSPPYEVALGDTKATRPLCVLDEVHRRVYVVYSLLREVIYYKWAPMDDIAFPAGPGIPFITHPDAGDINNPTSTKQSVAPSEGIVVVASSKGDRSYWHNRLPAD
jgi:hypothetical protein